MRPVRRWRSWLRAHPTPADAGLAALVFVVALPPLFNEETRGEPVPTVATLGLLGVGCAALVVRRRHAWWAWAVTAVCGMVGLVLLGAGSTANGPSVVALYTLVTLVSARVGLGVSAVSVLAPTATLMVSGAASPWEADAFDVVPWMALAAATGMAVRSQRAVVGAAHERARQAEASREEEAQRQVAEERLRIARELHDVVAHHVSVINVQAAVAGRLVHDDPEATAEAIAHIRQASQTILAEVPALLGLLRNGEGGVETAPAPRLLDVDQLVEQARRAGTRVVWETTGQARPLLPVMDLTAYRVVQEAITNAVRHGNGVVRLRIAHEPRGLGIEIDNDVSPSAAAPGNADRTSGRALDRDAVLASVGAPADGATHAARSAAPSSGHHGLVGMRERVAAVGGTLTVGPSRGGWSVRAWLPMAGSTGAAVRSEGDRS